MNLAVIYDIHFLNSQCDKENISLIIWIVAHFNVLECFRAKDGLPFLRSYNLCGIKQFLHIKEQVSISKIDTLNIIIWILMLSLEEHWNNISFKLNMINPFPVNNIKHWQYILMCNYTHCYIINYDQLKSLVKLSISFHYFVIDICHTKRRIYYGLSLFKLKYISFLMFEC